MAQYFQLIGQGDQPIQAVTIEELRQYYPNITCVETGNGMQYVINQEDATTQFQPQQVIDDYVTCCFATKILFVTANIYSSICTFR